MKKRGKVPRAVTAAQAAPKVNPFELKKSKKKFDVLGKRDKASEARNVIKSREDAVEKVGLLQEVAAGAAAALRHATAAAAAIAAAVAAAGEPPSQLIAASLPAVLWLLHLHLLHLNTTTAQEDAAGGVQAAAQGQHVHRPPLWRWVCADVLCACVSKGGVWCVSRSCSSGIHPPCGTCTTRTTNRHRIKQRMTRHSTRRTGPWRASRCNALRRQKKPPALPCLAVMMAMQQQAAAVAAGGARLAAAAAAAQTRSLMAASHSRSWRS